MAANPIEYFVSADEAAAFLHCSVRRVLDLTREGKLPAYPLDPTVRNKQWRYLLSELSAHLMTQKPPISEEKKYGTHR